MSKKDYYETLGVERNVSEADLKKAFKRLAMKHHPDRNPDDKDAEGKFKEAKEAYEVLSDAQKRAAYDQFGHAGVDPRVMGLGPIPAVKNAMTKAGLKVSDMDVIESNEAFAAQACAVAKDLDFDPEKTNPNGGAVALGHPVGATGCIISIKALYELRRIGGKYALATMCIGGGQGIAAIYERI